METATSSSYLDCYLYTDSVKLTTKRDDFNFPIVNFLFLSSNILSAPVYGVYVSQLIRYARACSNYQDFMERGKVLTTKLLSQVYQKPNSSAGDIMIWSWWAKLAYQVMLTIRGRLITPFILGSMPAGLSILIRHSFTDL